MLAQALSDAGVDAYFACAEYLTPNNRKAINAFGAWAFWVDIDCGMSKFEAGKGYLDEAVALAAVKKFCEDAGLPMPTHIVSSGGGLHAYWVLESVLGRETWQTYAGKLKSLARALAFLADDSRTADIASVLRIPGTVNFKYQPPRPVTLLQTTNTYIQRVLMLAAIDSAFSKLGRAPVTQLRAPSPKVRLATSNHDVETSNYGAPDLAKLSSALITLDPDCDESTWKLKRLAPLARAAGELYIERSYSHHALVQNMLKIFTVLGGLFLIIYACTIPMDLTVLMPSRGAAKNYVPTSIFLVIVGIATMALPFYSKYIKFSNRNER